MMAVIGGIPPDDSYFTRKITIDNIIRIFIIFVDISL